MTKRKHRVYRKYKDNKHPACIRADREANKEIKRAKYNFEKKLAINIKRDTKSFYAHVRRKAKVKTDIGPLVDPDGGMIASDKSMSEQFNKFFIFVFIKEDNGNIPLADWLYTGSMEERLCGIKITEE